jgi:hypothetical protein
MGGQILGTAARYPRISGGWASRDDKKILKKIKNLKTEILEYRTIIQLNESSNS